MPDLIVHNARLWNGEAASDSGQAIALSAGKILAIGADAEILALASTDKNTSRVDARDAIVLPGLYESHMHLFEGGVSLSQLNLAKVMGLDALRETLLEHASQNPNTPVLACFAANYTIVGEQQRLDRYLLDQIIADRPVYIIATDFHTAWANTIALEQAGILAGCELRGEASVEMGADGLATGELREFEAMNLVNQLTETAGRESLGMSGHEPGEVSGEQFESDLSLLSKSMDYCASHGITKIINMDGNFYQLKLLAELRRRDMLHCRVELPFTLNPDSRVEDIAAIKARMEAQAGGMLSVGRIKMFMDGVFDNWTALVCDHYPDRADYSAVPLFEAELFKALCSEVDRLGWQICVHAVGDGAVRAVLDGYQAARQANGRRDSRHRIEHIDTIHNDDMPRLTELEVIASMQPVHPPGSAGLPLQPTLSLMGRDRWHNAFAWQRIWNSGVVIAFATDWPVSPLDPLYAIQCAMTRKRWHEGLADQRLTLQQCVQAYTVNAAYAAFDEAQAGGLEPGMRADLAFFKGDISELTREGELQLRCVMTICDGRIIYRDSTALAHS